MVGRTTGNKPTGWHSNATSVERGFEVDTLNLRATSRRYRALRLSPSRHCEIEHFRSSLAFLALPYLGLVTPWGDSSHGRTAKQSLRYRQPRTQMISASIQVRPGLRANGLSVYRP